MSDGTGGDEDPRTDEQHHRGVAPEDVADSVLVPGDPDRIRASRAEWETSDADAWHAGLGL